MGTAAPDADAEVIEFGYRFLREAGVPGVAVKLNSLGDQVCRPPYLDALRAWLDDRRDELCADSVQSIELNPMRVLDCKVCSEVVAQAPSPSDFLCEDCEDHFAAVRSRLDAAGVVYEIDQRLVRGLDYYTRTAFEYVGSALDSAQTAVGGGGRYDGLAEVLGGPRVPGVGLALGLDRIVLSIPDNEQAALDVFVVNTESRAMEARSLLSDLRSNGVRADGLVDQRSLKAQFKAADRRAARAAVVVAEEWADGNVVIKDLADGKQELIKTEEIKAWLKSR